MLCSNILWQKGGSSVLLPFQEGINITDGFCGLDEYLLFLRVRYTENHMILRLRSWVSLLELPTYVKNWQNRGEGKINEEADLHIQMIR